MKFSFAISIIFCCISLFGQTVRPLGDINPGVSHSAFDVPNSSIYFNNVLYFTADDGEHGSELMSYDGRILRMVKDIRTGSGSSSPRNFYIVNNKLIFNAFDGSHGIEWWTTDGSEEGTELLIDIYEGTNDGVWKGDSDNPSAAFYSHPDFLIFSGTDSNDNFELWKTDGTSEGTNLIKNIAPDTASETESSYPQSYASFKNEIYFSCNLGLWKTDGTEDGTVAIKSEHPNDENGFMPSSIYATENHIFMIESPGVWSSDGTEVGTINIATHTIVGTNWLANRFTQVGDLVLFPGADSQNGNELWKSDGTINGTSVLVDLWAGTGGFSPQYAVLLDGNLYYIGNNGASGSELYTSDGTADGTKIVKDIKEGNLGAFNNRPSVVADDNLIFMTAGQVFSEIKLWQSDGSESGTIEVSEITDATDPLALYPFDNKLFFFARTAANGWEPYIYDPFGVDADIDGFTSEYDCDDNDSLINPEAEEIINNDIDENCDGEIGTSVSIEIAGHQVNIYPNPVADVLYISDGTNLDFRVDIYNIQGMKIYSSTNPKFVDMAGFSSGQYFIRITSLLEGETMIEKLIKN